MVFKVKEHVCTCGMHEEIREYDEEYIDDVWPPDGSTITAVLMAEVRRLRDVNAKLLAACRRATAVCTCFATARPDVPCVSCVLRAAVAAAEEQ